MSEEALIPRGTRVFSTAPATQWPSEGKVSVRDQWVPPHQSSRPGRLVWRGASGYWRWADVPLPERSDGSRKPGEHGVGRLVVTSCGLESLSLCTEADAVREGFADVAGFRAYWMVLHGGFDPAQMVWRVAFRTV